MNRIAAALAILCVAGCTWGRSKAENCTRFRTGDGLSRIAQLATASRAGHVDIEHNLCSDKRERLEGLAHIRRDEVGWCARIVETIPSSPAAVGASVGRWCDHAVARQVRYAHWTSVVGDSLLFVGELDTIEQSLRPAPQK